MEDDYSHSNDYIHTVKSGPLLLKMGDLYVIGRCVTEINEMTAQFTMHHEIINPAPDEKETFKHLLENGSPPEFISGGVSSDYMTDLTRNYRST